ncbi:MAG: hypothetical protein L0Y42_07000 [Phycisphaerales bacterium]|nr:hypothetical protein [Phycisphaerales bacterium]
MLLLTVSPLSAAVEIKLKDGSKWRGEIADVVELRYMQQGVEVPVQGKLLKVENLYVQVEATTAGKTGPKTIFKSDIVSMKTVGTGAAAPAGTATPSGSGPATANPATTPSVTPSSGAAPAQAAPASTIGVHVLPLEGGVGQEIRRDEFEKMLEYLDTNYGPGQIVVLLVDTNGGAVTETEAINKVTFEMKKRHRVVAWIHKAISAGCAIAAACNEVYFMTEGTAGSVTSWNPGTGKSATGEELERGIAQFARTLEAGGHYPGISAAMKTNPALLSYDKDPVTGDVTWHDTLEGEYDLSGPNDNLCFNSSNALHCGFSDGTADTGEELAKLLNLPKWHEASDYGRKIAKEWQQTWTEAQEELPLIQARLNYKNTGQGDPVIILGTRISLLKELIGWLDRMGPNTSQMFSVKREDLEREIAELRKQVADIKRAQRERN